MVRRRTVRPNVLRVVPVERAARMVSVTREHFYCLIRNGEVRSVRYRGKLWIPLDALRELSGKLDQRRKGVKSTMAKTKEQLIEENVDLSRDMEEAADVLDDDDLSDEEKVGQLQDLFGFEEDDDD